MPPKTFILKISIVCHCQCHILNFYWKRTTDYFVVFEKVVIIWGSEKIALHEHICSKSQQVLPPLACSKSLTQNSSLGVHQAKMTWSRMDKYK